MRVTSIGLWANDENVATFSYEDPFNVNPYMLRAAIGLDAEDLTPGFYGFGSGSGEKFFGVAQGKRDIVLRIILNPNSELRMSFSDLRSRLYRAISATRASKVSLLFSNGATTMAQIEGRITKFEVPHNSQTPELQITVHCDDPLLRAVTPVYLESADLASTNPIIVTDGLSTAPHGVEMGFTVTSAISQLRIHDPDGEWGFELVYGFQVNDEIYISSVGSSKEVKVTRSSVDTGLADKIKADSLWPIVFPGANEFEIDELASVDIDYIQFYPTYWGV